MISESTIEKVRELSIVDVVSKLVPDLKKAGSSWRALSPFTTEKSPSFYVHPGRGIFKCFSTGKGGDGISFVMQKENLPYVDAIKYLCSEFHIPIEYEVNGYSKEHYDEIELLYKVNHAAALQYVNRLMEVDGTHPAFTELINKRRFSPDTILQWNIGFAPGPVEEGYSPEKWNFLASKMIQSGYYKQGIELGLIKTENNVNYDVFRNRITFPIIDHHARYVGFGARALKTDKYNAKYINSTESRIFQKSRVLYGLHFASNAIRKAGYANLMEGYTDVISFHQSGHINTVGTCGTALTGDQAKLLKKYTNKAVLIYDPDEAGQNAAARNVTLLTKHGFQVSIVPMPAVVEVSEGGSMSRDVAFITSRTKEFMHLRSDDYSDREVALTAVKEVVKIDPDELVRMF